jgi:hypothetical protein
VDDDQPYVFFRNMVVALLGLFLFGQALIFHYMVTDNATAAYFWWAAVTGGVPSGVWLIWHNLRARMTGERLTMQIILLPFVGVWLVLVASMLASGLIYGS